MSASSAMQQLLGELLAQSGKHSGTINEQLIQQIASTRSQVAELAAMSSALTGEPSMLNEEADAFLTCRECREQLPAYVDDRAEGLDVAVLHRALHDHVLTCAGCRAEVDLLLALLTAEDAAPAPAYANFESWFAQQGAGEAEMEEARGLGQLWQQVDRGAHQLLDEIGVRLDEARAIFATLPGGLQAQTVSGLAFRSQGDATVQLVELPHPDANIMVRMRTGQVINQAGTLILEISTIEPLRPVSGVRITLRDGDGALLEASASDAQGQAIFDELEPGTYRFRIEHGAQTWIFSVNLSVSGE